jgi:16S rRNA (guanine966-N2)-methyltransferase
MRIVGGVWAGRPIVSPARRVRATSEQVRAAWLDSLAPHLDGARVLHLFAGSGALGLEALSRGAMLADFVESGPGALHALKANVVAFHLRPPLPGQVPNRRRKAARVFKKDAIVFVGGLEAGVYDIAFADPPYGSRKVDLVLQRWKTVRFSRVLAAEHAADQEVPRGSHRLDFGKTAVTFFGLDVGGGPGSL